MTHIFYKREQSVREACEIINVRGIVISEIN